MQKSVSAGRGKRTIAFITDRTLRLIDSDDGNANRISAAASELDHLIPKIIDYAIDLLDHSLREYLHLNANLNRGDWSSPNLIAGIEDCSLAGNNLAKCSIAAASSDASASILNIQYAVLTR